MSRFLFIGPDHPVTAGGREQLARLHHRLLGDILGDRLDTILLPQSPLNGARAVQAAWSGRINGSDRRAEANILDHIAARDIAQVWLDGSNLGILARAIKRRFPRVELFSFFHNIEARFFLGALRQRPGLRALGVFAATLVAERAAARWSDRRVVLNQRDADGLRTWHRRAASDVLPMAIADGWRGDRPSPPAQPRRAPYLLFVGGAFYANTAGIAWFAEHVSPLIDVDTLVVGKGMDRQRAALERHPRVKVVGRVDDLAPYYRDALAVVAPIFDGSGMKTKVAEAWMHGKTALGTSEAFAGYDPPVPPCNDAAAFVRAIATLASEPPPAFDPALRALYEQRHSPAAMRAMIERMIASSPSCGYRPHSSATPSP